MLPGRVPNLYPNTNFMSSPDVPHVQRPVHIGTVMVYEQDILLGFQTNGQYNRVLGIMMSDNLLFLRTHNITTSKTYFNKKMVDLLQGWSSANNSSFYDKVFADEYGYLARLGNMPNTQTIRD